MNKKEGVQKGKIPPCRIGYLISVSNRDTNKSRVPNTFWTPSYSENADLDMDAAKYVVPLPLSETDFR